MVGVLVGLGVGAIISTAGVALDRSVKVADGSEVGD